MIKEALKFVEFGVNIVCIESVRSTWWPWILIRIPFFSSLIIAIAKKAIKLAYSRRLRWLDGAMPRDSRYFAIVRLATWIPWSASKAAILLSLRLSGIFCRNKLLNECSNCCRWIFAAIVSTGYGSAHFSSKMPRGVCMNFWVVS